MQPFLAYIRPIDPSAHPEHPIVLPEPPLGFWGGSSEPFPTPPIYIQIPPGIIEGPPPRPAHPIWLPVFPAHPIVIPPGSINPDPPIPAHPIVLPPGYWGPNDPRPTPPIYLPPGSLAPGVPAHPIYLPPTIWGPGDPRPTPPIYLPGGPGNPLPPVTGNAPAPPMAYPIELYAHVPGLGVVGPVTVHYPGPLPSQGLPGPQPPSTPPPGGEVPPQAPREGSRR